MDKNELPKSFSECLDRKTLIAFEKQIFGDMYPFMMDLINRPEKIFGEKAVKEWKQHKKLSDIKTGETIILSKIMGE